MIDGHVHLENGPLTKEYVYEFIKAAQKRNISTLHILDHTHRFYEFYPMYKDVAKIPIQKQWLDKKQKNSIQEYWTLIEEMKKENLPIEVKFGLEVCYAPQREKFLEKELSKFPYDFLVGSVHSIDGILYDMEEFSKELLWEKKRSEEIYKQYYKLLARCIKSNLFTQIGHPDVIKLFGYLPHYDLIPTYQYIATLANENGVSLENNTGAHYRYHHPDIGLNLIFKKLLEQKKVSLISCSDAHYPKDVGNLFEYI